jgi:hypothetical protein
MPFTPFHFGPASVVKAIAPGYFSLSAFVLVQVAIDVESLYNMINGRWPIHSYFHSYLGSTAVALLVTVFCAVIGSYLLATWNRFHGRDENSRLNFGNKISWTSAASGSFVGAYSHVFLDSITHSDIQPLWPFSSANHLHQLVSLPVLHIICALLGLIGFTWLLHLVLIGKFKA